MAYKHGTYGFVEPSGETQPTTAEGQAVVYVGTAPIHYTGSTFDGKVNRPLVIHSIPEAKQQIGYSDDFDTYTLCEAVHTHFANGVEAIGPIVVINVFDPEKAKEAGGTATVALTGGVGVIDDDLLLDTVSIEGKKQGEDFTVEYVDGKVLLTTLTEIASPVLVTYTKVKPDSVTKSNIIGAIGSDGKKTGIYAIGNIYPLYGMIPGVLNAPKWSEDSDVRTALEEEAKKINGKWDAICVADIPASEAATVSAAIAYKKENGIMSKLTKLCWPRTKVGGKLVHTSTAAAALMQLVDTKNGGTPYESPSNKEIGMSGMFLDDGSEVILDFVSANALNETGITTGVAYDGTTKLWGPHMANYNSADGSILVEDVTDASIRMNLYLSNEFQRRFLSRVDGSMSRKMVDNILDESQVWANGLVSDGKLIACKITFDGLDNPANQMAAGDFVFNVKSTNTPVGKSYTFRVKPSTDGLDTLMGGE